MTLQRPDPLNDLLAEAASDAPSGAVPAPELRARAVRRRARHRALQAGALAAAALAVVVGVAVTGLGSDTAMVQPADPTPTAVPTSPGPTDSPTDGPTDSPTDGPTDSPTDSPTDGPTDGPTQAPSDGPTQAPTDSPTDGPTQAPTDAPTDGPTDGPTQAPTDGPTSEPATPVLTAAEAAQGLTGVAFREEQRWAEDLDFPSTTTTEVTAWAASGCWAEAQEVPKPSGALGMRTVTAPGPESGQVRQLAVFPDAATAGAAFADLRATIRGCQAASASPDRGGVSTEFVGAQLQFGDESFWTADKQVVVSPGEGGGEVGSELFYSVADLLVLDGNVVTVLSNPAYLDSGREETVANLSAEWEQLRPQYAPMLR